MTPRTDSICWTCFLVNKSMGPSITRLSNVRLALDRSICLYRAEFRSLLAPVPSRVLPAKPSQPAVHPIESLGVVRPPGSHRSPGSDGARHCTADTLLASRICGIEMIFLLQPKPDPTSGSGRSPTPYCSIRPSDLGRFRRSRTNAHHADRWTPAIRTMTRLVLEIADRRATG